MMLLLTYSLDQFKYLSHFLSKYQIATSTPIVNCNSKSDKNIVTMLIPHSTTSFSKGESSLCPWTGFTESETGRVSIVH